MRFKGISFPEETGRCGRIGEQSQTKIPETSRPPMKTLLSILGISAALVMAGVSAAMNYVFLASLGKSAVEGAILGAASSAADMLKCLLPFYIAWAWRSGRFVPALAGSAVFALFAAFSLLSAIGFAAENRGVIVETRTALSETYDRMRAEYARMQKRRAGLPAHRPASVVALDLRAAEQSPLWARTKSCTDATVSASRSYCTGYFALRAELATAEAAARLDAALAGLQDKLARLKRDGAGLEQDPQVSLLSRLFAVREDHVRLALIIAVALVVELGASLGLYLAAASGTAAKHRPASREKAPEPAQIEQRPVGCIESFVLEGLIAKPGASMSAPALYSAYADWCTHQRFAALEQTDFTPQFTALARAVGLPATSDGFEGIGLER